jgi:hypothetical protein
MLCEKIILCIKFQLDLCVIIVLTDEAVNLQHPTDDTDSQRSSTQHLISRIYNLITLVIKVSCMYVCLLALRKGSGAWKKI